LYKGNGWESVSDKIVEDALLIASSFFSLINPAIEVCEEKNLPTVLFISLGFFVGGAFIIISSKILDNFFKFDKYAKHSGIKRSIMLTSSMTIHNIPEGMAIGVAFGALAGIDNTASLVSTFMLAIGIAIQNIPEGASVSIPLHRDGVPVVKSFFIGSASGFVEFLFAPLAFLLCYMVSNLLPFLLAFAAGTMIAVAVCELLPEAVSHSKNRAILFLTLGFVTMAILDLALG
jgi:ZIP family zinc transporter